MRMELLDAKPLVVVRGELAVFRARVLGEPRPVDVPPLAWVPVVLLPALRDGIPVEGQTTGSSFSARSALESRSSATAA